MIFSRSALRRAVPTVLSVLMALAAGSLPLAALLAQEAAPAQHGGGEAALVLPDLGQATFLGGINGRTLLLGGPAGLRPRPRVRPRDLHAAQEHAGAPVDARGVGADLRDLQDLPA